MAAWQSHGVTDEQIATLCDMSMQGDRGITKSFGCELVLGETIAKGYSKCEIRFKKIAIKIEGYPTSLPSMLAG